VPKGQAYEVTMYIMAGLLVVGFICNLLVKPVHAKHYMRDEAAHPPVAPSVTSTNGSTMQPAAA